MLPEDYHAKACRLFRIAAERIYQAEVTTLKENTTSDNPTTTRKDSENIRSRKRSNLQKERSTRKENNETKTDPAV